MDRRTLFWKLAYLAIAAGAFLIDQTTKSYATRYLRFGEKSVISGFLTFAYAKNPGVAFSMFDQQGDSGRWGLSIVAFVAAVLVMYFFWRTPRSDDRILGALALLLAGISGNLCDRLRLGFVIDWIDVQFGGWHYPTFNIADCCICIGAGLLLLDIVFSKKKKRADDQASKT
ncbi:MAG: signal peptidase II, partial [Acidobacteria bacterium]|nr:signal peptidase II [Acidobacteriota bacterium]